MRRSLWSAAAVVAVAAVAAVVVVVVGVRGDDDQPADNGPGSLVAVTELPTAATASGKRRMQRASVTYRSTSGDGGPTDVTGMVFIPAGPPPEGGWPVVGVGHPTTGIDEECAPSRSPTLRGMLGFVGGLIDRGWAVAVTDYAGLGTPGPHRYFDHRTAAFNVIDSVRALRHVYPSASPRWAAFGASQGGAAVWAADEQAGGYAPELDLVGAAAIAPAADMSGLVDKAAAGTMTVDQTRSLATTVEALARIHPDLHRDDYRRGAVAQYWDVLTACRGDVEDRRPAAESAVRPGDLAPADPEAADRLRAYLQAWSVPQGPLSAPLFVAYGGRDASIDEQWTRDAVARACSISGPVESQHQPDSDHHNVDFAAALTWLADRFADEPVRNTCAT
ncbi:alpha/beta hydrolase [Mycolicibacterium flavescens]|uniref:lipase family protein n=1 Tax=Mycolicibacterium flavescens TaxID=1776 RepID=UPI000D6B1E2A|nr:lipase family protein [Mycolicibacterium flavescens]MCV7283153.1 alpha/beta hydrolase [Mycolicibacterium flavescens]